MLGYFLQRRGNDTRKKRSDGGEQFIRVPSSAGAAGFHSPLPEMRRNTALELRSHFQLIQVFQQHQLAHLLPAFLAEEIDFRTFLTLTEEELQIFHLSPQDQNRILSLINKFKKS